MAAPQWSILTATRWLSAYRPAWLRPDLVAGLTLASYLLPAGIGDASLAGLPPEAGLYACLFSGLVFWLFCTSTLTVITVTSALSLLIGASIGELSGGDPARHAALAAGVTLLVAVIAFSAWLVRAGAVVAFFSETVLVGFKAGLALYLASTQLPKLCGFKGAGSDFWERSGYFIGHLGSTHEVSFVVGAVALALLVAGKLWLKNRPVAFVVIVCGMIAARLLDLQAHSVALLGAVPQGLPAPGLPAIGRHDLNAVLPIALAAFVLGAVETSAIGRSLVQTTDNRFDANQELLALSVANLASGLGRGFPVSGGMSQSLVNASAGARTPLSGLVAALFTLVVALYASGLLSMLPQPVLAAVVLAAVMNLVDIRAFHHIWRFSRAEFLVAFVAFAGVLEAGPVNGVLLGAAISIVLTVRHAARPRVVELGRIPGTSHFADRSRHPESEVTAGVLVMRCESALLYFNADYVRERVMSRVSADADAIGLVVLSLGAAPNMDLAGAELVADLHRQLRTRGIDFRLADTHGAVRDALHRIAFETEHGPLRSGQTVDLVVSEWRAMRAHV